MAWELNNKTAVVTGGATGLGLNIAEHFLKNDVKEVVILDMNLKQGTDSVNNLNTKYGKDKAVFFKCDVVTDLDEVSEAIIKRFGKIDILVNNAGIADKSIKRTINVNVTALMEWTMKFIAHMKNGNGGTIINMSSRYGFRIDEYLPIYQGSKFAVIGFTRSIGHVNNYKKTGVRVVALCPGYTRTELTATNLLNNEGLPAEFRKYLKEQLWQDIDAVGNAAVEIFERAESGSAWLIEGNKPVVEVP